MKVGYIAEPNSKGQIVIPKKIRDDLKIDENTHLNLSVMGDGIWLHPIREVITASTTYSKKALLEALERTRGIWASDKDFDKRQRKIRRRELKASRERKKAWW